MVILRPKMNKEDILKQLKTERFGKTMHVFESLESTNVFAKGIAAEGTPEGSLVLAEFQTQGKGRLGRAWYSSPGENLTFSLILRPRLSGKFIGIVSLYASLCVANAVKKQSQLELQCKWPNDILFNKNKICGILSESIFAQGALSSVIIGVGLNVNEKNFPADLRQPATSLAIACKKDLDRVALLCEILQEFEASYALLTDAHSPHLIERWSKLCPMFGKEATITQDGKIITGIARAIGEDGQLILDTPDGLKHILAGDATLG